MNEIYVSGHRNPDTDSIVASMAYAKLRNALGDREYKAVRIGAINDETQHMLDHFGFEPPEFVKSMRTQVRDLDFDRPPELNCSVTMDLAWRTMREGEIATMPIVNDDGSLYGMLSAGDIASYDMETIYSNHIDELPLFNLLSVLEGRLVNECSSTAESISGDVTIALPQSFDDPALISPETILICGDQREIITNATLSYVEPYASSACELVAEILQYVADSIRIKSPEADAMYAGIVIDTNNFTNQAGVRTFEAAAFLRRNGADVTRVRKLFRDSMEDYKARAEAVRQAEVYKKYFAISVCPAEGVESPTVVGAQAANELLDIVGMKASVVLTPYEGKIYISARSIDEVNVQVMMEKLGGGGHRTIAGAQLPGATVEEAKEKVKGVIDMMLEKGEI